MPDLKISELPELVAPVSDDLLVIVDTTAAPDETKKVKLSSLLDNTAGGTDALTTKAPTSNVMYDHGVATTGVHGVGGGTVVGTGLTQTLTAKTLTSPAFQGTVDGWIGVTDSWTYASATTITVPSGAASIYSVGDKIRLKQGAGFKYYYVIVVADTLLTVTGGSDYTVATPAAITDVSYSKAVNPVGFPSYFNLGAPTWTTDGVAFTNQPANIYATMRIVAKSCFISILSQCNAISGGTGKFTYTPAANQVPAAVGYFAGSGNTDAVAAMVRIVSGAFAMIISKYDGSTFATNNEYMYVSVTFGI